MSYNSDLQKNNTALGEILNTINKLPNANSATSEAVLYVAQELTDEQKAQARENIGVGEEYRVKLIQDILESIGVPVYGLVDENNNIVLKGTLTEDTYTVKYEMEDGSIVDIGQLVLDDAPSEPEEPTYTNLLPLSVDINGNDYVGDNGENGYRVGYRIKSSGEESASDGAYCTGFMPISADDYDDYVYVKNLTISTSELNNAIALYDTNKNKIFQSAFATSGYTWAALENDVLMFRILGMSTVASQAAFFRFSCGGITDETIVTVNEKIE